MLARRKELEPGETTVDFSMNTGRNDGTATEKVLLRRAGINGSPDGGSGHRVPKMGPRNPVTVTVSQREAVM